MRAVTAARGLLGSADRAQRHRHVGSDTAAERIGIELEAGVARQTMRTLPECDVNS
jgi:hypothetical protein